MFIPNLLFLVAVVGIITVGTEVGGITLVVVSVIQKMSNKRSMLRYRIIFYSSIKYIYK